MEYLRQLSIIVNFRGGHSDRLERMCNLAAALNIPTVYDIDDLVFDPSLADQIDACRKMGPDQERECADGMRSIERALRLFDCVTASTRFLADYVARFTAKPTWIIPFGVDQRQLEIGADLPGYQGGPRFITYLSGTNTHERDFAEAVAALRRILVEYDDVYVKLVGHLDIDKHLPGLRDKVIQIPFIHWQSLVFEAASAYVNIAPFEMMACGLPVVDPDVNGNEVSYGGRENCTLAAASPRDIADKIYEVLDNPAKAADLRQRGIRYAEEFPTEIEMVRLIESYMVKEHARVVGTRPALVEASR